MLLLDGATITVKKERKAKDSDPDRYTAWVKCGPSSKTATAADPVRAVGLAVMLQAGYTENRLKADLEKEQG